MHICDSHISADHSRTPLNTLEGELTTLAAHLNAGNYRFLELLAEFERRGGHVGWGIVSCAHWLQWKCGIGLVAAREKVRVARALEQLPKISDGMRRGALSYCKVRALTRIATPENESLLVSIAENGTVSHVEKMVRLYRKTDRAQELASANAQHAERRLRCYFDDSGALVVEGRLDPEQGALVLKALQAATDVLRKADHASREASEERPDCPNEPYPARMADALALLSETFLANGEGQLAPGDRHLVTVHLDEALLRDDAQEHGFLASGPLMVRFGEIRATGTLRSECNDRARSAPHARAPTRGQKHQHTHGDRIPLATCNVDRTSWTSTD